MTQPQHPTDPTQSPPTEGGSAVPEWAPSQVESSQSHSAFMPPAAQAMARPDLTSSVGPETSTPHAPVPAPHFVPPHAMSVTPSYPPPETTTAPPPPHGPDFYSATTPRFGGYDSYTAYGQQPSAYQGPGGGQWPGQQPSPYSAQPGYAPNSYSPYAFPPGGSPGQTQVPPSIQQFGEPRTKLPWILSLIALLLIAAVVAITVNRPDPSTEASPSSGIGPSQRPPESYDPTMRTSAWELKDKAAGHWEVLEESWKVDEVTLKVKIDCTKGRLPYTFYVFTADAKSADPEPHGPEPYILSGTLDAGKSVTGYVRFKMNRGKGQLILTTSSDPISGLPIKG